MIKHVGDLLKSDDFEDKDLSDINFAIQVALSQGGKDKVNEATAQERLLNLY